MSEMTPPPPPPPPPPDQPPAAGGPPPSSGGNLDAGAAISYGWKGMTQNLGTFLLIALVIVVIQVVLSVIGYGFDNYWVSMIWNILVWIVGLILAMGLIRAALSVVDGGRPEVGMLFRTERLAPYLIASILVGLAVGVGLILCIIPGLILAFLFAFFGYAIVDGRTDEAIESMKVSWNLVSKNVGSLILLFILVFLINLVGALLCGIGLLFTYPITAVALAYAWRTISGGRVAQLA